MYKKKKETESEIWSSTSSTNYLQWVITKIMSPVVQI